MKAIKIPHFKSIIDTCFPLEETARAHRYVEDGQKKGSVVINVWSRSIG